MMRGFFFMNLEAPAHEEREAGIDHGRHDHSFVDGAVHFVAVVRARLGPDLGQSELGERNVRKVDDLGAAEVVLAIGRDPGITCRDSLPGGGALRAGRSARVPKITAPTGQTSVQAGCSPSGRRWRQSSHLTIFGLNFAHSKRGTSNGQLISQKRQPMQRLGSHSTIPNLPFDRALKGQAEAQAGVDAVHALPLHEGRFGAVGRAVELDDVLGLRVQVGGHLPDAAGELGVGIEAVGGGAGGDAGFAADADGGVVEQAEGVGGGQWGFPTPPAGMLANYGSGRGGTDGAEENRGG